MLLLLSLLLALPDGFEFTATQAIVDAGVAKIAFRYANAFLRRATDSGGRLVTADEVDKMSSDVATMEQFLRKYGATVVPSLLLLKELLTAMTREA